MMTRTTINRASFLLRLAIVSLALSENASASSSFNRKSERSWGLPLMGNGRPQWMRRHQQQRSNNPHQLPSSSSSSTNRDPVVPQSQQKKLSESAILRTDEDKDKEEESSSSLLDDNKSEPTSSSTTATATTTTTTATTSGVLAALSSLVRNPSVRHWAANGLQIGLVLFLARAVWESAAEVLEEFSNSVTGVDTLWARPEQVDRVLDVMQHALTTGASLSSLWSLDEQEPHVTTVLHLARRLVLAGMPLRSAAGEAAADAASVDSLLRSLTKSEADILLQCLWTPTINIYNETLIKQAWNRDICGLHSVKVRLLDSVAHLRRRHGGGSSSSQAYASLFHGSDSNSGAATSSSLASGGGGSGILLYGPPGCGKTMLIKALATTTRMPCLILTPSVLLRKYVGETNLKIRSLFSLANKLAPSILCIDELDGLFRERHLSEHEVNREIKTEFVQWWDGMMSSSSGVLVIGATNRPFDVDTAVLRRLSQSYFIGLPDGNARRQLLETLTNSIPLDDSFDVEAIALGTEGYSPSDLRQVLQTAALGGPLREAQLQQATLDGSTTNQQHPVRALQTSDVRQALQLVRPTPLNPQYRTALANYIGSSSSSTPYQHDHLSFQQQQRPGTWETHAGNFFDIGTLEIDHETFEIITDIAKEMETLSDDRDNADDSDLD